MFVSNFGRGFVVQMDQGAGVRSESMAPLMGSRKTPCRHERVLIAYDELGDNPATVQAIGPYDTAH